MSIYETLWHPDGNIAVSGRTFNLTTMPAGDYSEVEGHLTEEYEETDG